VLAVHGFKLGPVQWPCPRGRGARFRGNAAGRRAEQLGKLHHDVQLYARVSGTAELLSIIDKGMLDFAIGYACADDPDAIALARTMWFGSADKIAPPPE
jgi:hypothetical protein